MTCFIGIIPSRYGSTRFPGKPLAMLAGKPMFWHVYMRARQCGALSNVVLATDDVRIQDAAQALDVPCLMTRADHTSGTDRVFEAAEQLGVDESTVLVNIQGDEPLLDPEIITQLTRPFADDAVQVTTPVCELEAERVQNPNQVKVVTAENGDALYFSRSPIPFIRDADTVSSVRYLGHIGLYAFRMGALRRFVSLPQGRLEQLEKLEQLRFLENGIPIRTVKIAHHVPGVDSREDFERVRKILEGDA